MTGMHRDPTFDEVLWLECQDIKNHDGCSSCENRGENLAWDEYDCKLKNQKNKFGSCRAWQIKEDE
ncbi:MAG: hypothetical protein KZQ83_14835 [gamma proteobacterium symbiont of Taylorina sp.]|nr:hypothetical protein [gamma proteobacterium symbiont of Taylorina sp.]